MATEMVNSPTAPPNMMKSAPMKSSTEPTLDDQGNILPYASYKVGDALESKYCQPSPIPRLAAAAAFKPRDQIPTAGGYAINMVKAPQGTFPSELLECDEIKWVLGKMNPAALEVSEPAQPVPIDMSKLEAVLAKYETTEMTTKGSADGGEEKVAAAPKNVEIKPEKKTSKPKSAPSAVKKPTTTTPASPRTLASNPKTAAKSPGRGGDAASATGKLASPRSGSKKIVNAKVDVEIEIEKKNY